MRERGGVSKATDMWDRLNDVAARHGVAITEGYVFGLDGLIIHAEGLIVGSRVDTEALDRDMREAAYPIHVEFCFRRPPEWQPPAGVISI